MSDAATSADIPEPATAPDPRSLGISLNRCESALVAYSWPAVLDPLWPELRERGIRDDHVSGRFLDALQIADVVFDGGRFDFADEIGNRRETVPAVVFPIFDEFGETVDVGALCLKSRNFAVWLGAACMLGTEKLFEPDVGDDGVKVHASALAWLRARRRGVYIIDPLRARWILAEGEFPLVVDDVAFGRKIRDALCLPSPQVYVAATEARRAL